MPWVTDDEPQFRARPRQTSATVGAAAAGIGRSFRTLAAPARFTLDPLSARDFPHSRRDRWISAHPRFLDGPAWPHRGCAGLAVPAAGAGAFAGLGRAQMAGPRTQAKITTNCAIIRESWH